MRKLFYIVFALASLTSNAEIWMPNIFSNDMILQRGEQNRFWGKATPNAKVTITANSTKTEVIADTNGKWSAMLPVFEATKSSFDIIVSENDNPQKTIKNVVVGEVWIAGGQSNMEFKFKNSLDKEQYIETSDTLSIRYFAEGVSNAHMNSRTGYGSTPAEDTPKYSRWINVSKDSVNTLNAIPYMFAAELAKKLDIPIGIVNTGTPGTSMKAWVSKEAYETSPYFEFTRKNFENRLANYNYQKEKAIYDEKVRTYDERVKKAKAEGKTPPPAWEIAPFLAPWKDSPEKWSSPYMLYNLRIHPILNYTAKGIIWYQGESDLAKNFSTIFEGLILEWRKYFGKADMPFVFVQLPSFNNSSWPETRAEQEKTANKLKNVYMACSIDTGDKNDVHPCDKVPVAKRMSYLALKNVYGINTPVAAKLNKVIYKGTEARIFFHPKKFKIKQIGELRGIELFSNGQWQPANAELKRNMLIVKSPNNTTIEGVRYLWKPWAKPDVCLYYNDIPIAPFKHEK